MDGDERRRPLTLALAIVAIVATLALLIGGLLVAPAGEHGEDEEEASVAATADGENADHDEPGNESVGRQAAAGLGHDDGHADAPAPTASDADGVAADHHVAPGGAVPAVSTPDSHHALDVVVASPGPTVAPTVDDGHGHVPVTAPPADPGARTTSTTLPVGPIISLDDPRVTAEQRAAAQDLIDRTTAGMARFTDEASVLGAGYISIGDGATGFEHFVNVGYLIDGYELDPGRIESIVFRVEGGTKTIASAMYILRVGSTMDSVPDIAGELTTWHDHQNLCWEGIQVVGILGPDGRCARGEFRPTPPMLHVWMVEHPCGPFAGIEGGGHGDGCGH